MVLEVGKMMKPSFVANSSWTETRVGYSKLPKTFGSIGFKITIGSNFVVE
ncbi:hypothetical protein HanXRQr2_Chr03g0091821 [Helianthus annuus]|uniref:Uncharacterized protein n=1 Tax=Helianthus annuus TaxID=4232 RepID=A0A9K3JD62_HELAN|nr:hypothetical protein HanXRQr2_Chr03g0091821 [Helianthus annuus]